MCVFLLAGEYKAHVAAKEGNLQLLSMLVKESHCGINDRDGQESTPLHKGKIRACIIREASVCILT